MLNPRNSRIGAAISGIPFGKIYFIEITFVLTIWKIYVYIFI